ncbi:MAG: hypothetical protein HC869_05245 [Rhodospirillales bacterium]|nr:hypothetical protein [Rhodospirillales bacterium]
MIEAWRESGEPAAVFARRHELQPKRLRYWAKRLRAEATESSKLRLEATESSKLALVPATVLGAELSATLRAGGVTIELASATAEQVAKIAQVLAGLAP